MPAIIQQITQQAMAAAATAAGQMRPVFQVRPPRVLVVRGPPPMARPPGPARHCAPLPLHPQQQQQQQQQGDLQPGAIPANGSLAQVIGNLVGQLLTVNPAAAAANGGAAAPPTAAASTAAGGTAATVTASSAVPGPAAFLIGGGAGGGTGASSFSTSSTSSSTSSSATYSTTFSTSSGDPSFGSGQMNQVQLVQLMRTLVAGAAPPPPTPGAPAAAAAGVVGVAPGTDVTSQHTQGAPQSAFFRGLAEFMQAAAVLGQQQQQQATPAQAQQPPSTQQQQATPAQAQQPPSTQQQRQQAQAQQPPSTQQQQQQQAQAGTTAGSAPAEEALTPDFFSSVVQGVLNSVLTSLGGASGSESRESIASFIQRLSNTPSVSETGDVFFGELLTLVCESLSMTDVVMLLHGQSQPLQRLRPQLTAFCRQHFLHDGEPTEPNIAASTEQLVDCMEQYVQESFASVAVRNGVDILQTNLCFVRERMNRLVTYILCNSASDSDAEFARQLLVLCNGALFEWLALNRHCLRDGDDAIIAVINSRVQGHLSADVNSTIMVWIAAMMESRLREIMALLPPGVEHVVLQHVRRRGGDAPTPAASAPSTDSAAQGPSGDEVEMADSDSVKSSIPPSTPLTSSSIPPPSISLLSPSMPPTPLPSSTPLMLQSTPPLTPPPWRQSAPMQSPPPATTAEEAAGLADRPVAMDVVPPGATLGQEEAATGAEALVGDAWASAVPPDWVPVMRHDIHTQRRVKPQAPFSDAYLSGMPAKRRKTMQEGEGGRLSLADALRRAARGAGAQPVTSVESLARDADATQAAYRQQVKSDIKKRLKDDSDYDPSRFPNSRRVFEDDDS